jgi:acylphosphatase
MPIVRAELRIRGLVQGVGYRMFAQRRALELGLCGHARNLDDGSVEAVVEGPEAAVDSFIAACRTGPRLARVEDVEVTRCPAQNLRTFVVD